MRTEPPTLRTMLRTPPVFLRTRQRQVASDPAPRYCSAIWRSDRNSVGQDIGHSDEICCVQYRNTPPDRRSIPRKIVSHCVGCSVTEVTEVTEVTDGFYIPDMCTKHIFPKNMRHFFGIFIFPVMQRIEIICHFCHPHHQWLRRNGFGGDR